MWQDFTIPTGPPTLSLACKKSQARYLESQFVYQHEVNFFKGNPIHNNTPYVVFSVTCIVVSLTLFRGTC